MLPRELYEVGRRQSGVVSVRQCLELGVARSTLDDAVRSWGAPRPHRGVALLPGADPDAPLTRVWVGLCGVGSPAWASAATALALHLGLDVPARVDLAVPADRRPGPPAGTTVRRLSLAPADVTTVDRVPVLAPLRALRELAVLEPYDELVGAVARVVQRRRVTLTDMTDAAGGRAPGGRQLRRAARDLSGTGAQSMLAQRATRLLRQAGIAVTAEVSVRLPSGRRAVLDLAVDGTRIAVEVDGHAVHGRRGAASADRTRGNQLALAGWTVLRVDWLRLERDPGGFVGEVRAAIAAAVPA